MVSLCLLFGVHVIHTREPTWYTPIGVIWNGQRWNPSPLCGDVLSGTLHGTCLSWYVTR